MRFAKLHLENWRNFRNVDVALQERMFFIGANATGKSNLLDVFRFLRDIVRVGGGLEKAVADRNGIAHVRNISANRNSSVVIDVHLGEDEKELWRYCLAIGEDHRGFLTLKEEKVWRSSTLLLDRPTQQDFADSELLRQTHLEQISSNREFRDIATFFDSVRYYHIVPQLVREPERAAGRKSDPYGGDFLEQIISSPKRLLEPRLRRIQSILNVAVPQLQHLRLDIGTDSRGSPHLFGRYGDVQSTVSWHTEADFSDGTLRLIGLLWALLDEGGPLLLEEPELSLHQGIVRRIPGMMAAIQQEHPRQMLVSTHSDDLLRDEGIAPDEVLILRPTSDGTKVESGLEVEVVKQLLDAGLTVAEAALPITQPPDVSKLSLLGEGRE